MKTLTPKGSKLRKQIKDSSIFFNLMIFEHVKLAILEMKVLVLLRDPCWQPSPGSNLKPGQGRGCDAGCLQVGVRESRNKDSSGIHTVMHQVG